MRFEAIFFDLYNTLIHFDFSMLPEVKFKGQTVPTTSVEVHRRVEKEFNCSIPYQRFIRAFLESKEHVTEIREKEYREVSCLERFKIVCRWLDIDVQIADFIVKVHMGEMFRIMYCPERTKNLIGMLSEIPLVLVSNFDHAETVYRALDGFGLKDYFCDIFISDAIGWRKPGRKFFEIVLEKTQHDPKRCLYVGDDVVADVLGATRAGFQVAWLMGKSQIEKPARAPRWIVSDLQEIVGIVKGSN